MRLRWLSRLLGLVLIVGAAAVAATQIEIHDSAATASCGSIIDVASGSVGWRDWLAADLAVGSDDQLPRTEHCPGAANRRLAVTIGLATLGLVALAWSRPRPGVERKQTQLLGRVLVGAGTLGTAAGLIGLALVLANERATLFLYIGRPVVALLGLVALLPVLALVVVGRALDLLDRRTFEET